MAGGIALKFQGSKFYVQDGLVGASPLPIITGITGANPAVVTSNAHGLENGEVVYIASVGGMTEVNGRYFVVANEDTNTFELADTDATGYGTYTSGGTFDQPNLGNWCELTGYNVQGGTAAEIDTTTICSTAVENVLGLRDRGSMTLDFNYAPLTNIQQALEESSRTGDIIVFRLDLPSPETNGQVTMFGRVQQASFSGAVGGKHTGSMTIRLTGDIYAIAAPVVV